MESKGTHNNMPTDDIILAKASIIERCIRRIREEYEADPELQDWTHMDAMTLNIERACQAAIDMAMHVVSREHLGVPESSGAAFELLKEGDYITADIAERLEGMVGFRNVAVHQYQELDKSVLRWVAESGWKELVKFCRQMGIAIRP